MNELDYENRLTKVEERAKSNTHQINELKPVINEIHTLSKTMVLLVEQVKGTNDSVNDLKEKVESIEKEPATRWKDSTRSLFNAFLGAIGTAVAGGVIYLLTMIK